MPDTDRRNACVSAEIAVLRAAVTGLLGAYYRARPADTRLEKAALAALPVRARAAEADLLALLEAAKQAGRRTE